MPLNLNDEQQLRRAKRQLENPGFAAMIANFLGRPIEEGLAQLPDSFNKQLGTASHKALKFALNAALVTMDDAPKRAPTNIAHTFAVAWTGGIAGCFGASAVLAELPVSTALMLRSVAAIARAEGESISDPETQAECLKVFGMGGHQDPDDGLGMKYFAIRRALAWETETAARTLTQQSGAGGAPPRLVQLIVVVGQRFGLQVTQKAAAQLLPLIGAVGGVSVNTAFITHFQSVAHGHFTVRRIERKYGQEATKAAYSAMGL